MIKAYEAYKKFNKNNIDLISVHTLKPLDKIGISKVLKKYKKIIIIEEHSSIGGLTTLTKNLHYDHNCKSKFFHLH